MSHGLQWTEEAYVAYPQQHRAHARAWTWRPGEPPDPENPGQDMPEARRLAQGQALAQREAIAVITRRPVAALSRAFLISSSSGQRSSLPR
jgi:hypothetical protein